MFDIETFRRTRLEYEWSDSTGAFRHNYGNDWHVFIIWHEAAPHFASILSDLAHDFVIRFIATHQWNPEKLRENTARFYHWFPNPDLAVPKKIGEGGFTSIVVEDRHPRYRYDRTVSGQVMLVSEKVVRHKARYRDLAGGFNVHSSSNLAEFFEQATLLYGPARLRSVLSGSHAEREHIPGDLHGATGWGDLTELFDVLNLTCRYVVLRNFESLPHLPPEDLEDIDLLCGNVRSFVASSNSQVKDRLQPYKCVITVDGHRIPVDARYVGDGYLDSAWAADILQRHTVRHGIVNVPREDDHFFSLLYHAKLQKHRLKEDYVRSLPRLAGAIGLDWVSAEDIRSDASAAAILNGYMETAGYHHGTPIDPRVQRNREVERLLSATVRAQSGHGRRMLKGIVGPVVARSPRKLRALVPSSVRRRLRQSLVGR